MYKVQFTLKQATKAQKRSSNINIEINTFY